MSGEYHGWDQEGDHWRFAETIGKPRSETVFLIENFGENTSAREALSAIMSAMAQFQGRIQVVQTTCNDRLIEKLRDASKVRVATITVGDEQQWGILGVQAKKGSENKPWWKFW